VSHDLVNLGRDIPQAGDFRHRQQEQQEQQQQKQQEQQQQEQQEQQQRKQQETKVICLTCSVSIHLS
jgi:hypothetical protein